MNPHPSRLSRLVESLAPKPQARKALGDLLTRSIDRFAPSVICALAGVGVAIVAALYVA